MHIDFFYFNIYSISHYSHHFNTSWQSYFISFLTEYLTLANNIIFKYFFIQFELFDLFFINEWMILFLFLLYTTVHNINYSILKVNNYHTKHHEMLNSNLGPDFFDLLFNTKNIETLNNELIDHFVPNIIGCFLLIIILKSLYKQNKKIFDYCFILSFCLFTIILLISSIFILKSQILNKINTELDDFIKRN